MTTTDRRDPRPQIGRRKDESPEAHAAFLVFVALAPEHRSGRRVHILLELPESSVRLWRGRYQWEARIATLGDGEETEALAAEQFATHYAAKLKRPIGEFRKHLRVAYAPPPMEKRSGAPPPAQKVEGAEGAAEGTDPLDEASTQKAEAAVGAGNVDRIGRLLNVAEIRILQAIANGKVKYGIGDIEKVLRIKERLEKSRRALLLESQGTSSGSTAETLAKSERVQRAQADGGDVLAAVAEDLDELALIVSTLRDAEASNVVPLSRAREGGG